MIKIKYKGRTFTNGRALAAKMTREPNQQIERRARRAAEASGVRFRKSHKGFQIEGDAERMGEFRKRFSK